MGWIGILDVTPEERSAPYPCDGLVEPPVRAIWRAIDVDASPATLFRWLCQLKVAPYSYDRLDNHGRRSPRELTPGADALSIGDPFVLGRIESFEVDVHITCLTTPAQARAFGSTAVTYAVRPVNPHACRLVVKGVISSQGVLAGLRARLISVGDVPMMRKQLLTIKALAERHEHGLAAQSAPV